MCSWYKEPPIDPVAELRRFVRFLASAYGLLAGISTIFPLSNYLFQIIPLPRTDMPLFTTVALIMSIFSIFFVFVARDLHYFQPKTASLLSASFFICWIVFLIQHLNLVARAEVMSTAWELGQPRDWMDLLFYSSSFMFLTLAFATAGLMEYMRYTRLEPLQKKVAYPTNPALSKIIRATPDGKPYLTIDAERITSKDAILLMLYSTDPEPLSIQEIASLIATSGKPIREVSVRAAAVEFHKTAISYSTDDHKYGLTETGRRYVENKVLPKIETSPKNQPM